MTIQKSSPCDNRKKISAMRDLPYRCGTQSSKNQRETRENLNGSVDDEERVTSAAEYSYRRPKKEESFHLVTKKAGFDLAATRDFPYRCGTQSSKNQGTRSGNEFVSGSSETRQNLSCSEDDSVADRSYYRRKEDDLIFKKAGFNLPANRGRLVPAKRNFNSTYGSKVKPLSSEEAIRLMPSHVSRRPYSYSSGIIQKKPWPVYKQRHSPKTKKMSTAASSKGKTYRPAQHREGSLIQALQRYRMLARGLTPRDKVLEVLRLFKLQFEELEYNQVAGRIDFLTRSILIENGVQVNNHKMIGPVPGVEVGDKFQFKSELNVIGLHFDMRGGIDYITKDDKLATSIVVSEGNGYSDRYTSSDVIIYSGQGGNVISKDLNAIEDQKLVTGNLALANSMKTKDPVRVIRGRKRLDQRGKHYVYEGLYLVQDYWQERGPTGNRLFKFKLCRIPGQTSH